MGRLRNQIVLWGRPPGLREEAGPGVRRGRGVRPTVDRVFSTEWLKLTFTQTLTVGVPLVMEGIAAR
jgi:hypothetical protein